MSQITVENLCFLGDGVIIFGIAIDKIEKFFTKFFSKFFVDADVYFIKWNLFLTLRVL